MKYLLFLMLLRAGSSKGQLLMADSMVAISSLKETLLFLSQDSLRGRLTGAKGADIAATFIAESFNSTGLTPAAGNEGYFDNFLADYNGKKIPAKNVVGILPGNVVGDTIVIFSAHYDHIGEKDDMPDNKDYNYKDDIFNGANDNATGVASLLELAKYYKARNNNRYSILFVAFSAEEMGMLGSRYFTKKINTGVVKAVINLEMLGRPVNENCFIVSFRNTAIRNMLNHFLKKYQEPGDKRFFEDDPYPDEELSSRSDHYPFARKIKNAFTIMGSSPLDTYYHTVDDEYGTIDVDFLSKATKKIAVACEQFTR